MSLLKDQCAYNVKKITKLILFSVFHIFYLELQKNKYFFLKNIEYGFTKNKYFFSLISVKLDNLNYLHIHSFKKKKQCHINIIIIANIAHSCIIISQFDFYDFSLLLIFRTELPLLQNPKFSKKYIFKQDIIFCDVKTYNTHFNQLGTQ